MADSRIIPAYLSEVYIDMIDKVGERLGFVTRSGKVNRQQVFRHLIKKEYDYHGR